MSFDTNWDVEKYQDDTEYDLHWELRKSFMETHKNKYPEDRLVALSKVFANMEFMGCMYNAELMLLVKNLSKQVDAIVQYTEDKKSKISRTFVKASDAVKKNTNPPKSSMNKNNRNKKRKLELVEFDESDDTIFERKRFKSDDVPMNKIANEADCQLYHKVRAQDGIKSKLIIYNNKETYEEKNKRNIQKAILLQSAAKSKIVFKFNIEKHAENPKINILQIKLDEEVVAQIETEKKITNEIKNDLAGSALEDLQKYCFTIIPNRNFEKVDKKDTETISGPPKQTADPTAMYSGVGARIMKLMGWKGEGLGKNETGIKTPIEATLHVRRAGLGTIKNTNTDKSFGITIRKYLENYLNSNEKRPLQFSAEFTKEERMKIHDIAQKMPLKSLSHGKGDERAIRIEKKFQAWELVEELLAHGGSTDSHTLIRPTALL